MKARYHLFGTYEESIAYDILTARPATYDGSREKISAIFVNFELTKDRLKAVQWLSEALKPILAIKRYWALSFAKQRIMDNLLFQQLLNPQLSNDSIFPLKYSIKEEYHSATMGNENGAFRTKAYYSADFIVTCNDSNVTDEDAIKALRDLIYPVMLRNYPELCYLKPSVPRTLMCINKYCKYSLFGSLPKEIAKMVVENVMADDGKNYKTEGTKSPGPGL